MLMDWMVSLMEMGAKNGLSLLIYPTPESFRLSTPRHFVLQTFIEGFIGTNPSMSPYGLFQKYA
jgi:hypothetical protein